MAHELPCQRAFGGDCPECDKLNTMDKIDLDAIITEEATKFSTAALNPNTPGSGEAYVLFATNCMKEAIHQALVLASENATKDKNRVTDYITLLRGESFEGWSKDAVNGYMTCLESIMQFIHKIDSKQSILDVEKLIV
jgi:hypothetical protein